MIGGPRSALAATGIAVALAACASPLQSPQVVIDAPGARMTAADVQAIVVAALEHAAQRIPGGAPIRVIRVVATHADRVDLFEPGAGAGDDASLVWLVRAEGAFYSPRSAGRDAHPSEVAASGFYIIDDGTGEIIGVGYP
jgi:hypothetical protein